jgi:hypothetical protein
VHVTCESANLRIRVRVWPAETLLVTNEFAREFQIWGKMHACVMDMSVVTLAYGMSFCIRNDTWSTVFVPSTSCPRLRSILRSATISTAQPLALVPIGKPELIRVEEIDEINQGLLEEDPTIGSRPLGG